jgi:hypothetical protein
VLSGLSGSEFAAPDLTDFALGQLVAQFHVFWPPIDGHRLPAESCKAPFGERRVKKEPLAATTRKYFRPQHAQAG